MVSSRLKTVLTQEELKRLNILEMDEHQIRIIADVHGMKCRQARRFINNIINTVRAAFQLIIVHGYNHGTAIKDMLAEDFCNLHVIEQHVDPHNKGVTHMLITA